MGTDPSNERSGAAAPKIFAKRMNANGEICCKTLDPAHRKHLGRMANG